VFNTRIVIYSLKPGFIIGKKGSNIRALTEDLEKRFELSKVHIEIGEIPNKDLDPKVVIENIFSNISRGVTWKSVVYNALRQIKEAGAIGAEIIAKGNTSGKGQRKRKSRFFFGYMKKAGDQKSLVAMEKRTTFPGLGTIGITLRIVRPDIVFSDKIDVLEFSKKYKMEIQEEELLERQSEVSKDAEEKVEKKNADKKVVKEDDKTEKPKVKTPAKKKVSTKKKDDTKDETKSVKEEKPVDSKKEEKSSDKEETKKEEIK